MGLRYMKLSMFNAVAVYLAGWELRGQDKEFKSFAFEAPNSEVASDRKLAYLQTVQH